MKKMVLFKIGEAEIKIEAVMPASKTMSEEGRNVMTINNALSALNKSFGFDVQNSYPNIRDTAAVL